MIKYMNSKQVMEYLNIRSYNTLYKFLKEGLPFKRVGGKRRFEVTKVDEFMVHRRA